MLYEWRTYPSRQGNLTEQVSHRYFWEICMYLYSLTDFVMIYWPKDVSDHNNCRLNIMHEKCGYSMVNEPACLKELNNNLLSFIARTTVCDYTVVSLLHKCIKVVQRGILLCTAGLQIFNSHGKKHFLIS